MSNYFSLILEDNPVFNVKFNELVKSSSDG
jgi:hypothetical protein